MPPSHTRRGEATPALPPTGATVIPIDRGRRLRLERDVAKLRLEAGPHWSPVAVARLAGLDLAVGRDDGSEHTTADCLIYLWHTDARERNMRVLEEMARALLLRHGLPARDQEALALAIELTGDVAPLDLRPGLEHRLATLAA